MVDGSVCLFCSLRAAERADGRDGVRELRSHPERRLAKIEAVGVRR